jgi:hypothetical protein
MTHDVPETGSICLQERGNSTLQWGHSQSLKHYISFRFKGLTMYEEEEEQGGGGGRKMI